MPYLSDWNIDDLLMKMNESLNLLQIWCSHNRLTVNASKTKAMFFAKNKKAADELSPHQQSLSFDGTTVKFIHLLRGRD